MALRPETFPRDADLLIEMVLARDGKIEALEATIAKLKTIIFGARSEKSATIIAEQLSLGLEDAEAVSLPQRRRMTTAKTARARTRPPRKRGRSRTATSGPCPSIFRAST